MRRRYAFARESTLIKVRVRRCLPTTHISSLSLDVVLYDVLDCDHAQAVVLLVHHHHLNKLEEERIGAGEKDRDREKDREKDKKQRE